MIGLAIGGVATIAAGLWLGRKWGLASGRKRVKKALAQQQKELIQQQKERQRIDAQHKDYGEKIAQSKSEEEAANVLAQINTDWNSGT